MSDFTREQMREWYDHKRDERENPRRYRGGRRSPFGADLPREHIALLDEARRDKWTTATTVEASRLATRAHKAQSEVERMIARENLESLLTFQRSYGGLRFEFGEVETIAQIFSAAFGGRNNEQRETDTGTDAKSRGRRRTGRQ